MARVVTVVTADYDGGVVVMRVAWAADVGTGPNDRAVSCRGVS